MSAADKDVAFQIIEGLLRYRLSYRGWCKYRGVCRYLNALDVIPKKSNGRLPNEFHVDGFGIRAVIELSALRLLIALATSLGLTLIYAVVYLKGHPQQLSNGSALWSVLVSLWGVVVMLPNWQTLDPIRP